MGWDGSRNNVREDYGHLFGGCRVDGAVMNVAAYNGFLARVTWRISQP
ncbi:MAG: hypothetical protein ACNA7G_03565 [Methylobacter sp.]